MGTHVPAEALARLISESIRNLPAERPAHGSGHPCRAGPAHRDGQGGPPALVDQLHDAHDFFEVVLTGAVFVLGAGALGAGATTVRVGLAAVVRGWLAVLRWLVEVPPEMDPPTTLVR
jgi:hypothetical protein